jgi:hypothetical protein
MPDPTHRTTWTRRRLAVTVSALLALVLAGAVAARADESAQPVAGGLLAVYATGQPPGSSEWVSVPAYVVAGQDTYRTGFELQVGPSVDMSLVTPVLPGGSAQACQNGYQWVFKSWNEHPADDVNPDEWYESTELHVYGIHDVPGQRVDHFLTLWFIPECL